jgi:hypothetical protein
MYSGIQSSRNAYRSFSYPVTEKKNQKKERVFEFSCIGFLDNGDPAFFNKQVKSAVSRSGRKTNKDIQCYRILQSFSEKEADPSSGNAGRTCHEIGVSLVQRLYPGHQATVTTQRDGKSGHWHNHIVVMAVNAATGKAARGRQTDYMTVRRESERLLKENGITPDPGKKHPKRKKAAALEGGYSWMDDLHRRVADAMEHAESFDDFHARLKKNEVRIPRDKIGKTLTFELMAKVPDTVKVPKRGMRSRSTKLDSEWSVDYISKRLRRNKMVKEAEKRSPDDENKYLVPDMNLDFLRHAYPSDYSDEDIIRDYEELKKTLFEVLKEAEEEDDLYQKTDGFVNNL